MQAYAAQPFALFDEDDGTDHLHADTELDAWNTKLLVSSIYDTKNLYAMSINHARNAILNLGCATLCRTNKAPTFVVGMRLVCAGFCRGTKTAFSRGPRGKRSAPIWTHTKVQFSFCADPSSAGADDARTKYVVTWMDRLRVENDVVLAPNYTPDAWEEPQIIFRSDAGERFDEALR